MSGRGTCLSVRHAAEKGVFGKKGIVSVNWVYVRNISFQIISQLRVDLGISFYKLGFFKKLFFFKNFWFPQMKRPRHSPTDPYQI